MAPRPIGVLLGLEATANPFLFCASYGEVAQLPVPERVAALRDPERKRRILAEHAEMSHDIDLEKARADLERAHAAGENDDDAEAKVARAWAEARIRAAEKAKAS